ncbi:MAG: class I SAM-dependent methyltransferase [Alphaproteobacteria bacterium]|nr:class I SAM-dependent methyltransferase [Alphaproteobacteria bacterium]
MKKNRIIVSLTSFPARIDVVPRVIKSLLSQSMKPDKVVLYLSKDEFKDKNLPSSIIDLKSDASFDIVWVNENIRSYKKLIYALRDFPDDIIITVDDDIDYPEDLVKNLIKTYKKHPRDICINRVRYINIKNGIIQPYKEWELSEKRGLFGPFFKRGYKNFFCGAGGVLYPPKSLPSETFLTDKFTSLCKHQDDVWFWAMAVKNNVKISVTRFGYDMRARTIKDVQSVGLWQTVNSGDTNPNNIAIENVIKEYPEIAKKIGCNEFDSKNYWINRYESGKNSGAGSYGKLAEFKAEIINDFVKSNDIKSVIEFGSGDGAQLALAEYPKFLGFDVSKNSINLCKKKFSNDKTKKFLLMNEYKSQKADLTLSLDVIYHLVEDDVFESYMKSLFKASDKFVIVYSSNTDRKQWVKHVKPRKFTDWVLNNAKDWELIEFIPNRYPDEEGTGNNPDKSFADFYIFKKK